jgi:response regulator NasT
MSSPQSAQLLVCRDAESLIDSLRFGLREAGYVCEVSSQNQLDVSVAMGSSSPALLVLVLDALSLSTVQQLKELDAHSPCPVILCVQQHQPALLAQAVETGASTYVLGECSKQRAALLAELASMRFQARQQLINDVENAKTKLRERKLVERAKGILMEKKKLSEQEAYRVMRQAAMNRAQPLVQVAASVIQVSELLHAS